MNACYNAAIRLLTRREHSRLELVQKLLLRQFEHGEINDVLDKLAEQRLQSDERFAENYVRHRCHRGYGPFRIEQELKQRAVAAEIVSAAIAQQPNTDWEDAYNQAVRRKGIDPEDPDIHQRAKLSKYLHHCGFSD